MVFQIDPITIRHAARIKPMNGILPFTYRDGVTFLRVLEDLIEFVNERLIGSVNLELTELINSLNTTIEDLDSMIVDNEETYTGLLATFMEEVNSRITAINEKSGPLGIQRITLDDDFTLIPDVTWPENQPIYFQVTQNTTGNHTLTYGSGIVNPDEIAIDSEPLGMTEFYLMPLPDGAWRVTDPREMLDRLWDSVGSLSDTVDDEFTSVRSEFSDEFTSVRSEFSGQITALEAISVNPARATVTHAMWDNTYPYTVIRVKAHPDMLSHLEHSFAHETAPTEENRMTLDQFANRDGGNIVVNCGTSQASSFIRNGQIRRTWNSNANEAMRNYAFAIKNDGTFSVYSKFEGHTMEGMVSDGVVHAFGYGPNLVTNGIPTYMSDAGFYGQFQTLNSGRTVYGSSIDNDLIIILVEGNSGQTFGLGGNELTDLALHVGCHNANVLDGGGSTQSYIGGHFDTLSSDKGGKRPLHDAFIIHDAIVSTTEKQWQNVELLNGWTHESEIPACRTDRGSYQFRGLIVAPNDLAPYQNFVVGRLPANLPAPIKSREVALFGGTSNDFARGRIGDEWSLIISTVHGDTGFPVPLKLDIGAFSGISV